ncbi:MAG: hypothetical protein WAW42_00695 [Candidatus Competibacteraceae bacterium]
MPPQLCSVVLSAQDAHPPNVTLLPNKRFAPGRLVLTVEYSEWS